MTEFFEFQPVCVGERADEIVDKARKLFVLRQRAHDFEPPAVVADAQLRALAFVIAPNVDIAGHLIPRLVAEKDDALISDLIFLAKIVCRDRSDCSSNPRLIEELRANCTRIRTHLSVMRL